MKGALIALALVTTIELVLGVPVYGPPQPLPTPQKYRPPNGAPIPAKYPSYPSGHSGKNEFYSKFNPHSLPPGLRGPAPQFPPSFAKYPHPPPPGKHQQLYQQQNQHQQQQHQPQQPQLHHHHQQQQQQQQQHHPQQHHPPPSFRPVGPQFQSKPHLLLNGAPHHTPQQGQIGGGPEQRIQSAPSRPTPKITNVWTGPKLSGSPDFPPRFPAVDPSVVSVTATPLLEKPRGPYIINSDDERGPIKTIPAPNLNPADKPANFEEQLYKAQHQQSYVQPLDNSITDEKQSYQVTEVPGAYKPFSGQPSYFAPESSAKVPTNEDANSVPLDIALQQHLENQHQQQLSAEHVGSTNTLTPQELYSLLNGNPSAAVVPQTAYMVPQTVMYAAPQPQSLDLQVGHQLQYQPQQVQLQYAQQPAATAVQLQYAQPAAAELQYLQPQAVQYQPQAIQYQPQAVQYQHQADHLQQQQQQQQQQQYQQQSAEQYGAQSAAAEASAQKQQEQQVQQEQQQEQQEQQQDEQRQREQLKHQQQEQEQQDNDVQYQQEQDDYEPRNGNKGPAERPAADGGHDDQKKFESIRDQYYSAVPNEQTAGVLAQIAQSAANNDVTAAATADEPSRTAPKPEAEKPAADQSAVQMHTSVQIQQSVPLYEATYASSRRTNQEYADEADELMEGSESVAVSESESVNGHAPSQFPYNAAKINAFAAN